MIYNASKLDLVCWPAAKFWPNNTHVIPILSLNFTKALPTNTENHTANEQINYRSKWIKETRLKWTLQAYCMAKNNANFGQDWFGTRMPPGIRFAFVIRWEKKITDISRCCYKGALNSKRRHWKYMRRGLKRTSYCQVRAIDGVIWTVWRWSNTL